MAKGYPKGVKFSEEHRRKINEGIRRYYETHDAPNKGIPHSDETRKKISDSCFKVGVGKWNKGKHYNHRKHD